MTPTSSGGKVSEIENAFKESRGFTLPELLAATVILAMAAALIVPSFRQASERMAQQTTARQLAADLRSLRNMAERSGTTVLVEFTETGYASTDGAVKREWPADVKVQVLQGVDGMVALGATPRATAAEINVEHGSTRTRIVIEPVTGRIARYSE